jgi:hypothetical protein
MAEMPCGVHVWQWRALRVALMALAALLLDL